MVTLCPIVIDASMIDLLLVIYTIVVITLYIYIYVGPTLDNNDVPIYVTELILVIRQLVLIMLDILICSFANNDQYIYNSYTFGRP